MRWISKRHIFDSGTETAESYASLPRVRSRFVLVLLLLFPHIGCARCSSPPGGDGVDGGDGGLATPLPLLSSEAPPPPLAWKFEKVLRENNVALPERCRPRGPLVRASVAKRTRFAADPRSLGALVVGDVADRPPRLTGVAALTLEPVGMSHDPAPVPWYNPTAAPRLARLADGSWIAAFDQKGEGGMSRVGLFRRGVAEILGEGDAFEAVDLHCVAVEKSDDAGAPSERCALLTSRIGKVAPAGALVWVGSPGEPAHLWRQMEVLPPSANSEARPFGLGGIEPSLDGEAKGGAAKGAPYAAVTVILAGSEALTYVLVGDGAPREIAQIPVEHGVIDAAALPAPVAMVYATPLDEDGCAKQSVEGGGAGIHFERRGRPPALVRTPAPPFGGAIRRLAKGALATWIAPLGCQMPRRVIYAVVLDAEGTPVTSPMAVADGVSFAVAASGEDVDLFLRHDAEVSWARMRCAP
jgi:hypothetical protein